MRLLFKQDKRVAEFVAKLAPIERPDFGKFVAVGIVDSGENLVGGIVFHGYSPQCGRIELSGAITTPKAASIRIARAILAYPFGQLGVSKVFCQTAHTNVRARRVMKGFGFREEGTLAHHYGPGRHAIFMRMLRSEWEQKHGQQKLAA